MLVNATVIKPIKWIENSNVEVVEFVLLMATRSIKDSNLRNERTADVGFSLVGHGHVTGRQKEKGKEKQKGK